MKKIDGWYWVKLKILEEWIPLEYCSVSKGFFFNGCLQTKKDIEQVNWTKIIMRERAEIKTPEDFPLKNYTKEEMMDYAERLKQTLIRSWKEKNKQSKNLFL
jgi:predicted Fe-S protein YdhL (DUF1289 family)